MSRGSWVVLRVCFWMGPLLHQGVDSFPFLLNVLSPLDQLDPQTSAEATLSRGLRTAEASAAAPSPFPRDSLCGSPARPLESGGPPRHVHNPFRTLLRWFGLLWWRLPHQYPQGISRPSSPMAKASHLAKSTAPCREPALSPAGHSSGACVWQQAARLALACPLTWQAAFCWPFAWFSFLLLTSNIAVTNGELLPQPSHSTSRF